MRRIVGVLFALGLMVWLAPAVEAAPIAPIPGSPFIFPEGGVNSNVVLLHPNERKLFVTNQSSSEITVLDVAPDGTLTFFGKYPTLVGVDIVSAPTGMAINPAGDRLYVTTFATGVVNVHGIAPDGSLTQLQSISLGTPSAALNGIVYVSLPGAGDFLYVDNQASGTNTVTVFAVGLDGLLIRLSVVPTGGAGGGGGYFAAPNARSLLAEGMRLYVVNGGLANAGSNDISAFDIMPDGTLAAIPGSPFPLPAGTRTSGSIAVDAGRARLYAGLDGGRLARFDITPGGFLLPTGVFPTGLTRPIDGLELHPCAPILAITDDSPTATSRVAFLETNLMAPLAGTPVLTSADETVGLDFNADGSLLFVGQAEPVTTVSVLNTSLIPETYCRPPGVHASVTASNNRPAEGSRISACVHLDMDGTGEALGSYGASLAWDPGVLRYFSYTGGTFPFDTPFVNIANVAAGTLRFADADATGASGEVFVFCATFDVIGTAPSTTPLDLELTSLFAAGTFADLLPGALVADGTVAVLPACTIGDVNADGGINSGDALILLANEVGLPLPPPVPSLIAAGCGDVNGDGMTNSTDANIILSYEVGLVRAEDFPLGDSNRTFQECPFCAPSAPALAAPALASAAITAEEVGPLTVRITSSADHPKRGLEFEVTVALDGGGNGRSIGSYGAVLRFDPRAMTFLNAAGGRTAGFEGPMVNRSGAAGGEIRFAHASPEGASGTVELLRVRFRALRALPDPGRVVGVGFTSLAAPAPGFENLLPGLQVDGILGKAKK